MGVKYLLKTLVLAKKELKIIKIKLKETYDPVRIMIKGWKINNTNGYNDIRIK